jgi:hypothetical protein
MEGLEVTILEDDGDDVRKTNGDGVPAVTDGKAFGKDVGMGVTMLEGVGEYVGMEVTILEGRGGAVEDEGDVTIRMQLLLLSAM